MRLALAEGNLDILRLLSNTTIRMIEGEIIGLEQNGRADLSIDDYVDVVTRKTGLLFGACCRRWMCITLAPALNAALASRAISSGVTGT